MKIFDFYKNMKPENKDNMRRLLWLFLLCLLAFGTGYYTARETNPKPVAYPEYVNQSSIDSLVHIIDSLKIRVQKIPEYRVKEKVVTITVYEQQKVNLFNALDTNARVQVFARWIEDSTGIKPIVSDTSVGLKISQTDYLTLQQYRYQKTIDLSSTYKAAYENKDSLAQEQTVLIRNYEELNEKTTGSLNFQKFENVRLKQELEQAAKDQRRSKLNNTLAWIAAGVGTGIMGGLWLAK